MYLRSSNTLFQETGSYSSQLSIGDAAPRHDGNYTCEASNMAATVTHSATLQVNGESAWLQVTAFCMCCMEVQIGVNSHDQNGQKEGDGFEYFY